jgi:hypothetical protein
MLHGGKSFGVQITIVLYDFATNIASSRYHAPVMKDSRLRENLCANRCITMLVVDSGSNPNDMAGRFTSYQY